MFLCVYINNTVNKEFTEPYFLKFFLILHAALLFGINNPQNIPREISLTYSYLFI